MKLLGAAVLAALLPALALAGYDPGEDRAALRRDATASYQAAADAAGRPLEPEKAAQIKTDLDESVSRAGLASGTADALETGSALRAAEMDGALKRLAAPSTETADARKTWKELSGEQADLAKTVDALPDKTPDGKKNEKKARLKDSLEESAASLNEADAALGDAESGEAAMSAAADGMKAARKSSLGPGSERAAADAEVRGLAARLPAPVAEAKAAVLLLGQEPRSVHRTRAGEKLEAARSVAGSLLSAADRACNRADDFASRSRAFDRARASYEDARTSAAGKPARAKELLDRAKKTQGGVRAHLDHN